MTYFNPECHTSINHIFHPSCKGLSAQQRTRYRVGSIVVGGCTLGLAHLIHHCRFHHFTSPPSLQSRIALLSQQENNRAQYDALIEASEKKVAEVIEHLKGVDFSSQEGLEKLIDRYHVELDAFINYSCEINGTTTNPWKDQRILDQFDLVLHMAFLIGVYNLIDTKNDREVHRREGEGDKLAFAFVITRQNTERYRLFFCLPKLYELVRGSCCYKKWSENLMERYLPHFYEENRKPFYQEGTKQSEWRSLYNAYCQMVYTYVDREDFIQTDDRFAIHTKEDHHPCAYNWNIGTIPT